MLVLAFLVICLSALPSASGQARSQADSPLTETITFVAPDETTSTPTEVEAPPSETPEPVVSSTPTNTPQPTETPKDVPEKQTLLLVGLSDKVEKFERGVPFPVVDIGLGTLGIYGVQVPHGQADTIMGGLLELPGVRYVEPDHTLTAQDTFPNDSAFGLQYALVNIRAPQAWDITTGSSAVTIAIVDSGVDLSHPELAPKLVPGYDFVNNDAIPQDDNGHGTHVAGIAAAASNNGLGMAGVSWGARIMPIKVLDASNNGSYSNAAAGVVWAVDHGAQVINLSFGGSSPSNTLESAIDYAAAHGVALAAAAGNTGGAILYPARYPAVIAVANTDAANQRVASSGYGPEIDLAAPGAGIYSLAVGGGYRYLGGTSMSTPHVSGALALLLSMPGVSAGQARVSLESSALDLDPPGWDIFTGSGLIQLDRALQMVISTPTPTYAPITITPAFTLTHTPVTLYTPGPPDHDTYTATWIAASPVAGDVPKTATPTQTFVPGSPKISTTPTQTLTTAFVSLTPTPTATLKGISPPATPPMPKRFAWRPCLGAALVLLGLLLALWMARSRRRR